MAILCIFLRDSDGNLNVPYIYWNGDRLVLNFNWLDNDFNDHDCLARSNSFHSPLTIVGGVSFFKDTSQPPAILPTSASRVEMTVYFNVYMNKFDQWVKHTLKVKNYIRYADDFVFLSCDKTLLERIIPRIQEFLQKNVKLTLHPDKLFLKTVASGIDFLGWAHFSHYRLLRNKTKQRMLRNIRSSTGEAGFQSYLGLISHGNTAKLRKLVIGEYWLW